MTTQNLFRLIIALSLASSFCGALDRAALAEPQGQPTADQCEQAKLKARAAEASANNAAQQARVAEEVAYQANQEANAAEYRTRDAEALIEAARRRLEGAAEASRRGYSLAPDAAGAERDYLQRLTDRDRARERAEGVRIRAADRRKDAETARAYANDLRADAEGLKKDAQDLCARVQPVK